MGVGGWGSEGLRRDKSLINLRVKVPDSSGSTGRCRGGDRKGRDGKEEEEGRDIERGE